MPISPSLDSSWRVGRTTLLATSFRVATPVRCGGQATTGPAPSAAFGCRYCPAIARRHRTRHSRRPGRHLLLLAQEPCSALLEAPSCWSDGMEYFSAVDQRVLGLQEIGETVELLKARIRVMLAV